MYYSIRMLILSLFILSTVEGASGESAQTAFQTASPFSPRLDVGSDQAIVYGVNASFNDRLASWRAANYETAFMTGISWGGYDAYYGADPRRIAEEIQTDKQGKRIMHGHSTTVGYNVPTPAYLDFLKAHIMPAIEAGVETYYLEEPEYWAVTGWSQGFKDTWQSYYGTPWVEPDSSVDAQFKASRLKYELYYNALSEVFDHIKSEGKARGFEAKCFVPTHSLLSYAQIRMISPESHLMDLDSADGYLAQVWTGTARMPNQYGGIVKERTFETAFLEYGQMLSMVRPSGRTVWFLADPVEDDPNHTWADYEKNYKLTLAASLFWPDVHRFEVMPWPHRVFNGVYPLEEGNAEKKGPMPAAYAVPLMASINALNDMDQKDIQRDMGSEGIGVIVSDTLMFQRVNPHPSAPHLGSFFGLALPLLKHGVPVEPVQLEQILQPGALDAYNVLLLTYEGQKPLRADYHEALEHWVRKGGALIVVGDGKDPYHQVQAWWNGEGTLNDDAYQDLYRRLGIEEGAYESVQAVGEGCVRILCESPADLQQQADGPEKVRTLVRDVLKHQGQTLETQNYLVLWRGPYVIAMGLDESLPGAPKILKGPFIDLFHPELALVEEVTLVPGTPRLLYDLGKLVEGGAMVPVASARVKNIRRPQGKVLMDTRGPQGTEAILWMSAPSAPREVRLDTGAAIQFQWNPAHEFLCLRFANQGERLGVAVAF